MVSIINLWYPPNTNNYSSYISRSNENICNNNSGGNKEKGKTKRNLVHHKKWWFFLVYPLMSMYSCVGLFFLESILDVYDQT
jgi:hypothetical protein